MVIVAVSHTASRQRSAASRASRVSASVMRGDDSAKLTYTSFDLEGDPMKYVVMLGLHVAVGACSAGAVAPPDTGRITIDNLFDIKHPSTPMWSPDGRHVAFVWDRAGVSNFYLADAGSAAAAPKALTSYDGGAVGNAFWSKDSQKLYFSRDGDLWQVALSGGTPQAVWNTPAPESAITPSPDLSRVAFVRPFDSAPESRRVAAAQGRAAGESPR